MAQTVTITRKEYDSLKKFKEIDTEILSKIAKGFEDIRKGRVREWK